MKTIALFNNKGGVGKTSLVYHLGSMWAEMGHRVAFGDLDPQANLSTLCLTDERIEEVWRITPRPTIYGAIEKVRKGIGDIERLTPQDVSGKIALVPGDLQLSEIEDDLSQLWPKCVDGDERALRVTAAMSRVIADVGERTGADIALLDVGPNFGAINRAALIAADHVVVPVAPDLFSMQGLANVGPRLATWRAQWADRRSRAPRMEISMPVGAMKALGYIVSRHSTLAGGPVKAFQRWIDRMPAVYRESFGKPSAPGLDVGADPFCLGQLKDYRSLMPMAQEAKKPMFLLKPADGAIGGHQGAVRQAYADFQKLAQRILEEIAASTRDPSV